MICFVLVSLRFVGSCGVRIHPHAHVTHEPSPAFGLRNAGGGCRWRRLSNPHSCNAEKDKENPLACVSILCRCRPSTVHVDLMKSTVVRWYHFVVMLLLQERHVTPCCWEGGRSLIVFIVALFGVKPSWLIFTLPTPTTKN